MITKALERRFGLKDLLLYNVVLDYINTAKVLSNLHITPTGAPWPCKSFWWRPEFIIPPVMASHSGPKAGKQLQSILIVLPCLSVGMLFFFNDVLCVLHQI